MAEYKEPKTRKIRQKDWENVSRFIKKELDHRRDSQYRKDHETIWKEVDRQLKMQPMKRMTSEGREIPPSWNSAFELGELSKASEIISADVMRITFPQERDWFEAHVEIPSAVNEQGQEAIDEETQIKVDGLLKALMAQQQNDFGFQLSVESSVKEALHHGSYVAEILWDQEMEVQDGAKVRKIASPTWVPHSMWNCYPDMSPRVIGTSMFYRGSMIIVSYMPLYKLKQRKGEGWMPSQFEKIPKSKPGKSEEPKKRDDSEMKDVELATYYGDIVIERGDGDIYLPNSKAMIANGIIVYWEANELPYPSVIFGGYEKQDIRDPYFTSPLIKQSPMQKLCSVLANKFVDSVALNTEPPIVYDGNDPYMVQNDGPIIAPGVKTPSKGSNAFQEVKIGEPSWALQGLEMGLRQMQAGTGVSEVRSAVPTADRQTAFEVSKVAQAGEVRTVDFIRKLNRNLQTWLYMQHALNIKYLKEYSFYNEDMRSKDFVRVTDKDLKQYAETAHFDVVGARGVLGEEQRAEKMGMVTAFASQNPLFAPLLKPQDLLLEAYRDAGVKNPERFVNQQQDMVPASQVEAAVQEATAPLQEELAKSQEALTKAQMAEQAKVIDAQTKREAESVRLQQEEQKIIFQHQAEMEKIRLAHEAKLIEIGMQREANKESAEAQAKKGPDTNISLKLDSEDKIKQSVSTELDKAMKGMTSEMERTSKEMKSMIDSLPKPSKRKKVKAPSGREYIVEDA
jgi:hypothetical protein